MPRTEIYGAIAELVQPGSMTTETIVAEISEEYPKQKVKIAVTDMLEDGRLEEHPEMEDVYRVSRS